MTRLQCYTKKFLIEEWEHNTLNNNISYYLSCLKTEVSKVVIEALQNNNFLQCKCTCELTDIFKKIGDKSKKEGEKYCTYWRYLVNLENLISYAELEAPELREKDIKHWLVEEVHHNINGNEDLFLQKFDYYTAKMFTDYFKPERLKNAKIPSIQQFCSWMNWNRGQGSEWPGIETTKNNVYKKGRKSKKSASLVVSDEKIAQCLITSTPQELRSFEKLEAKVRDVVSGDMGNYLKMDFISHLIEAGLHGADFSTLFAKGGKQLEMWQHIYDTTIDERFVKMPIDQSRFDHGVSRKMLVILFDNIQRVVEMYGDEEYKTVMSKLIEGMFDRRSKVILGDMIMAFRKGVASGWRWTALLDTIISKVEFDLVCDVVESKIGRKLNIIDGKFQGDDVRSALNEPEEICLLVLDTYTECGLNVHKLKTQTSYDRDEFLRLTISKKDGIVGYPARLINSICVSKPNSIAPTTKFDRIHSMVNNHLKMILRGCDCVNTLKMLLFNLSKWLPNNSKEDIINFLLTPTIFGGYGISQHDQTYTVLLNEKKRQHIIWTTFVATKIKFMNHIKPGAWSDKAMKLNEVLNLQVPWSKYEDALLETLPFSTQERSVLSKAHFEPAKHISSVKPNLCTKHNLISNSKAYFKELYIPSVLYQVCKDRAIQDLDEIWLKRFLTDNSFNDYELLKNRKASKSVIVCWLKGQVDVPKAKQTSLDAMVYSNWCNKKYDYYLRHCLSTRYVTMSTLRGNLLWLESKIARDFEVDKNNLLPYKG